MTQIKVIFNVLGVQLVHHDGLFKLYTKKRIAKKKEGKKKKSGNSYDIKKQNDVSGKKILSVKIEH